MQIILLLMRLIRYALRIKITLLMYSRMVTKLMNVNSLNQASQYHINKSNILIYRVN